MSYIILGGNLVSGVMVTIGPFPDLETAQTHLNATQPKDDDLYVASCVTMIAPAEHARQCDRNPMEGT